MTAKQLAQRLGYDLKDLDFEFSPPCSSCKKTGGSNAECQKESCVVMAVLEIKEE